MSLADIYARIPSVDCIPGCTDCCGVVPMNEAEAQVFGAPTEKMGIAVISSAPKCPHSTKGCCDIHKDRPFTCRLFGTVRETRDPMLKQMVCPHGRLPKVPLTEAQARTLTRRYFQP